MKTVLGSEWEALEDVRSARGVEHVRPLQEPRERLAVLTVADEAEAAGRRDVARNAAHAAAPAPKREVQWQACHEAEAEAEPSATIYLRVPTVLKQRVDQAAAGAKLSVNAWAMKCMERCITQWPITEQNKGDIRPVT